MAATSNSLYLYHDPFVISSKGTNIDDYLYSYLGDHERLDLEKIYASLLRFALLEKLIEQKADSVLSVSTDTNRGSWIWAVNRSNFRALVSMDDYGSLMSSLQSNEEYPLGQILELHARLGMLYDQKLLNTLVNRIMNSIQLIPHPREVNRDYIEWDRIHRETPFIWVIILLQNVIRGSVKPI